MSALRAAIVGLGQVGLLFDDDPKRTRVWTHFTSYERLADRYELVAVCDPDVERRERALVRRPSLAAFASLDELLAGINVDVISICTPIELHAEQVRRCAGKARAIVCEKPLAVDAEAGDAALAACVGAGTLVAVNYYKRFEPAVQQARMVLGSLGEPRAATAYYTGPLDAVGSHAVDLLAFLLGPLTFRGTTTAGERTSATFGFGQAGLATLVCAGSRENLVFELDVICSDGRLRVLDNCDRLVLSRFITSERYGGYRELMDESTVELPPSEPFLALYAELANALDGKASLTSDGASALRTQSILDRIRVDG